jgi:CRP-like cAMP-binding protein
VQHTYRAVIKKINFFKNRNQQFLQAILPCLAEKDIYRGEVLYSEGDGAEDIYFVLGGQIQLYFDISDIIDFPEDVISQHKGFNVPIVLYQDGSYFGD